MAAVMKGLWVRIEAKEGREEEVQEFLEGGQELVEQEPETIAWFAVKLDSSTFGIFDVFPDDSGRDAHLAGEVGKALMASVGELIEEPQIERSDVIASKLPD